MFFRFPFYYMRLLIKREEENGRQVVRTHERVFPFAQGFSDYLCKLMAAQKHGGMGIERFTKGKSIHVYSLQN